MKTFFAVFGVIFLILILIVLGAVGVGFLIGRDNAVDTIGFGLLASRTATLDHEGKAYADAVIPAIGANWNVKEVLDRQSPEFKQTVSQQQVEEMFKLNAALGHLQKCEPAQGQAIISITTRANEIKGDFIAKATFDKGEAVVVLSAIKHDDEWQILGLSVKSPALQAPQQPQPQQQPQSQ